MLGAMKLEGLNKFENESKTIQTQAFWQAYVKK
jgi:hypothetical protein